VRRLDARNDDDAARRKELEDDMKSLFPTARPSS
jgi:hypothetical protein